MNVLFEEKCLPKTQKGAKNLKHYWIFLQSLSLLNKLLAPNTTKEKPPTFYSVFLLEGSAYIK